MAYRWAPGTVAQTGYEGDPGRDIAAAFAANKAKRKGRKDVDEQPVGAKKPPEPKKGSRY